MPFTQTDLDTIDEAIASGVKRVKFADREIEFNSVEDLRTARTEILNGLSTNAGRQPVRMVRMYTGKGY